MLGYLWIGASSLAEKLINKWCIVDNDLMPYIILDNDRSKKGKTLRNIKIDTVDNIKEYLSEDTHIVITTSYINEVKTQLSQMNIANPIIDYREQDQKVTSKVTRQNIDLLSNKRGKRCFIVGNAPSLSLLDLSKIYDEDKIMVNSFYQNGDLLKLNPNYWVLADPIFWEQEEKFLNPIEQVLNTTLPSTKLLINVSSMYHISSKISNNKQIYYYSLSNNDEEKINQIDFINNIPPYLQNVISLSLMLAIHLKYESIYLIGCDHTWWNFTKEEVNNGIIPQHFYKESNNEKEVVKDLFSKMGYEGIQKSIERQKYEYQQLKLLAERNGINIYNATPHSYLEIYNKVEYAALF